MPACLEWREERSQSCEDWRDEGTMSCAEWDQRCDSWQILNWVCKAVTVFCVLFVWVSRWVCHAWVWTTTAICVVWDIVTTVINFFVVFAESTFGWVLNGIAWLVEQLERIPIIGTLVRWVLNVVTIVLGALQSLIDAGLGLIGIRPEKLLRACFIILRDEQGVPTAVTDDVIATVQLAVDVYKRDANVRIIPSRPFKVTSGFLPDERVDVGWIQVDDASSDASILDPVCNHLNDWTLSGRRFQYKMSTCCFFGAWRRVLGYGAPITCFIVRSNVDSDGGGLGGCGLYITDYVTVNGDTTPPTGPFYSPASLGHEFGHDCGLWHLCVLSDNRNLMAEGEACDPPSSQISNRTDPYINNWQVLVLRGSKHVTYF